LVAIHDRHLDIHQHQIDGPARFPGLFQLFQSLLPVTGSRNFSAGILNEVLGKKTDVLPIVDNENTAVQGLRGPAWLWIFRLILVLRLDQWHSVQRTGADRDGECAPPAEFALDGYSPAQHLRKATGNRQPQPRPAV